MWLKKHLCHEYGGSLLVVEIRFRTVWAYLLELHYSKIPQNTPEFSTNLEFFGPPQQVYPLSPPHSVLTRSPSFFSKRKFSSEKRLNRTHSVSVHKNLQIFPDLSKKFLKHSFHNIFKSTDHYKTFKMTTTQ